MSLALERVKGGVAAPSVIPLGTFEDWLKTDVARVYGDLKTKILAARTAGVEAKPQGVRKQWDATIENGILQTLTDLKKKSNAQQGPLSLIPDFGDMTKDALKKAMTGFGAQQGSKYANLNVILNRLLEELDKVLPEAIAKAEAAKAAADAEAAKAAADAEAAKAAADAAKAAAAAGGGMADYLAALIQIEADAVEMLPGLRTLSASKATAEHAAAIKAKVEAAQATLRAVHEAALEAAEASMKADHEEAIRKAASDADAQRAADVEAVKATMRAEHEADRRAAAAKAAREDAARKEDASRKAAEHEEQLRKTQGLVRKAEAKAVTAEAKAATAEAKAVTAEAKVEAAAEAAKEMSQKQEQAQQALTQLQQTHLRVEEKMKKEMKLKGRLQRQLDIVQARLDEIQKLAAVLYPEIKDSIIYMDGILKNKIVDVNALKDKWASTKETIRQQITESRAAAAAAAAATAASGGVGLAPRWAPLRF